MDGPESMELSSGITDWFMRQFHPDYDLLAPEKQEEIYRLFVFIVRKTAHFTEYFLLAVSVAFPLYVYGVRGLWLMFSAGIFCVGYACLDEYHQSFVAGRSPGKRDVLIDSAGVFFGIIVTRIVGWTGRMTIFRPLSNRKKEKR